MTDHKASQPDSASSWPGRPDPGPEPWWQRPRGKAIAVVGVVILALLVWPAIRRLGGGSADADRAVPVTAASAYPSSFVSYLSEPGTVRAVNSVVVRSRVAGQLTRIAFTGGQRVKRGDLLAEIDPSALQAQLQLASGDLAHSQVALSHAKDILKRYQTLLAEHSIEQQRVDDQQALVRQYAADVKSNQGRIDTANLQLSYTRITAPISGVVGLRRVDPGNLVGPSDPDGIVIVTQSQPSKVSFAIPADAASQVLTRFHQGHCIPVEARGDGGEEVLASGHLLAADNEVDPSTGTVKFEAEFANAEGTLLPNQFVTAKLPVEILPHAILVPAAAIQHGAAGAFVYVIKHDKTVAVAPVKLGPIDATTAVIEDGVAAGVKVVVEGADRLRAGTLVKASMMASRPASATNAAPVCQRGKAVDAQPPVRAAASKKRRSGQRLFAVTRRHLAVSAP